MTFGDIDFKIREYPEYPEGTEAFYYDYDMRALTEEEKKFVPEYIDEHVNAKSYSFLEFLRDEQHFRGVSGKRLRIVERSHVAFKEGQGIVFNTHGDHFFQILATDSTGPPRILAALRTAEGSSQASGADDSRMAGILKEMGSPNASDKTRVKLARLMRKMARLNVLRGAEGVDHFSRQSVTEAELKDHVRLVFRSMAKRVDAATERTMTLVGFQDTVRDVYRMPLSKEVLTEVFAQVDTNGSNSLSVDEFDSATMHMTDQVVSLVRVQLGLSRDALIANALLSTLALAAVLAFLGLGIASFGSHEAFNSSVRARAS